MRHDSQTHDLDPTNIRAAFLNTAIGDSEYAERVAVLERFDKYAIGEHPTFLHFLRVACNQNPKHAEFKNAKRIAYALLNREIRNAEKFAVLITVTKVGHVPVQLTVAGPRVAADTAVFVLRSLLVSTGEKVEAEYRDPDTFLLKNGVERINWAHRNRTLNITVERV